MLGSGRRLCCFYNLACQLWNRRRKNIDTSLSASWRAKKTFSTTDLVPPPRPFSLPVCVVTISVSLCDFKSLTLLQNGGSKRSDSVKRHLRGRHLSDLNLKFDFISDGGCTREEQIALSLEAASIPARRQRAQGFLDLFFAGAPTIGNEIEF